MHALSYIFINLHLFYILNPSSRSLNLPSRIFLNTYRNSRVSRCHIQSKTLISRYKPSRRRIKQVHWTKSTYSVCPASKLQGAEEKSVRTPKEGTVRQIGVNESAIDTVASSTSSHLSTQSRECTTAGHASTSAKGFTAAVRRFVVSRSRLIGEPPKSSGTGESGDSLSAMIKAHIHGDTCLETCLDGFQCFFTVSTI